MQKTNHPPNHTKCVYVSIMPAFDLWNAREVEVEPEVDVEVALSVAGEAMEQSHGQHCLATAATLSIV